jgi:hypothetical protein
VADAGNIPLVGVAQDRRLFRIGDVARALVVQVSPSQSAGVGQPFTAALGLGFLPAVGNHVRLKLGDQQHLVAGEPTDRRVRVEVLGRGAYHSADLVLDTSQVDQGLAHVAAPA